MARKTHSFKLLGGASGRFVRGGTLGAYSHPVLRDMGLLLSPVLHGFMCCV